MSYVVLARKWRPQSFESLTGQGHVARTLQNAITTGRIPHAMLLTGPRGVGKTSSARIIAMALNCEQGPTPTPCGTCRACQEIRAGRAVDILEIDGASNRGINEIRELRDSVQYAPSKDRYKVYIIDEVHMLTTEAFNALLKTLEEPPPHVIFIFATTEPQKIPVTILSRCQRFDFRQIALPDMIDRLTLILQEEGIEAEPEALHLVARQAAGGMRDALSLLDQVISASNGKITADQTADLLGTADRRMLFELSDAIFQRQSARAIRTLHAVLGRGTDVAWFAGEFAAHLRDLMVLKIAGTQDRLAVFSDEETRVATIQLAGTDLITLETCLDLMIAAAEEINRSSLGTLRFELALVRMCELETRERLDYVIALLEKHAGITTRLPDPPAATSSSAPPSSPKEASAGGIDDKKKTVLTPAPAPKPSEAPSFVEAPKPVETPKPVEVPKAAEAPTSVEAPKGEEARATTEASTPEPVEAFKPEPTAARAPEPMTEPSIVETADALAAPSADEAQPSAPVATPTAEPVETPARREDTTQPSFEAPSFEAPSFEAPAFDNDAPAYDDVGFTLNGGFDRFDEGDDSADASTASGFSAHEDAVDIGDETPAASTHALPAAMDGTMTAARWRTIVDRLTHEKAIYRFLANGYATPLDGVVEVALSDAALISDRETLYQSFAEHSATLCGTAWRLRIVAQHDQSEHTLANAWRIRSEEDEENEAHKQRVLQHIETHPIVQKLQEHFPTMHIVHNEIHFHFNEANSEESE